MLDDLKRGKVGKSYPENVRAFALSMHFYSPRAYNYLREVFEFSLPGESTIRSWYSTVDGSPGISSEAIDELKRMVVEAESNNERLDVCLMFDEMSIKQHVEWNHSKKKYSGLVQFGNGISADEDCLPIAKEAFVFMVVGVNVRFKLPVAYFLIRGIGFKSKASLIKQIVAEITECGASILALTFDGLGTNLATCRELGADFNNAKTFVTNPRNNSKICIILDACHMEKLVRNQIASQGTLHDINNERIEWRFFVSLELLQRTTGQLGNKLNKRHLQWDKKKMSVRLAVETLSESVAVAMEELEAKANCKIYTFIQQFVRYNELKK